MSRKPPSISLGVQVDQGPRGFVGGARRKAPRLFHAFRPHADHGGDRIRLGGDGRTAQCSRATAGANPIGRGPRLAIPTDADHSHATSKLRQSLRSLPRMMT